MPFFDPTRGGSAVLFEHMFWFYSHPAVYIFIMPAFGVISEVLPTFARKPIFGYKMIAFSSMAIAILGIHGLGASHVPERPRALAADAVHDPDLRDRHPDRHQDILVDGDDVGRPDPLHDAMLYAVGFLITFSFGGITGVFLASVPVDLHEHGTYFVVGHFHYVVAGGAVMGFLASIPYWYPKCTGRMMDERLGKLGFWLFFIGLNGTFLPMHWLGLEGMPRRYATYETFAKAFPDAVFWNRFETAFSFMMAASVGLLVFNVIWSMKHGKIAGINPWGARTLEWTIASPPPYYNFKKLPHVFGRPYDFDKPLPYTNTDLELQEYPEYGKVVMPIPSAQTAGAGAH